MLKLTFNTTTKTVEVTNEKEIIYNFSNIPTVKAMEEGYYEVIQESPDSVIGSKRFPVARFPISNTIMFIEK